MATRLQLRKGTTTEHSTFTGAAGEVTVDTTKKALVLHDGVTVGGKPLPTLESGKVPVAQLPDSTTSTKGIVQLATQTEVNSGTNGTKAMTPNTLRGGVMSLLNASGSAPIYACRAWVNFNGIGTPTIRASGNVSSITDNGVGDYTVNFTTAIQDANYALLGTCNSTYSDQQFSGVLDVTGNKLTTSQRVRTKVNGATGVFMDASDINIAVFR